MRVAVIEVEHYLFYSIIDSYKKAFEKLGCKVYVKKVKDYIVTEKDVKDILNYSPDFIIGYGTISMVKSKEGYIFRQFKIPSLMIFYDNPFFVLDDNLQNEMKQYPEYYYSFIWDDVFLNIYINKHLPNGYKIMLAVDRDNFYPLEKSIKENSISFVGEIFERKNFLKVYNEKCDKFINDVIELKINNLDIPVLEICEYLYNNISEYKIVKYMYEHNEKVFWDAIYFSIHTNGGGKYRYDIINAIEGVDVFVYGGCNIKRSNIISKETVKYGKELSKVYNYHNINLNLSTFQLETSINNRPFDCFGSKSFLLSDYKKDLEVIFPNHYKEVSFKSLEELGEKGEYYLTHPKEREEITEELYNIVINNHTYYHRAKYILNIMKDKL